MANGNESRQVLVPRRSAPIEQIIEFADTYDGYSLIAADPEQLERVLWPIYEEVAQTSVVPNWIGLDLARALLFYAQRLHYWSGGSDPEELLRALVVHIGEVSGGQVTLRRPEGQITHETPLGGPAKHGEYADSWEYSHDGVYRWWYERRWAPDAQRPQMRRQDQIRCAQPPAVHSRLPAVRGLLVARPLKGLLAQRC